MRRYEDRDCNACLSKDCDCECKTCTEARTKNEKASAFELLLMNLNDAINQMIKDDESKPLK